MRHGIFLKILISGFAGIDFICHQPALNCLEVLREGTGDLKTTPEVCAIIGKGASVVYYPYRPAGLYLQSAGRLLEMRLISKSRRINLRAN